ncbi:MAG: YafY family transcriptional regulator [Gammaproteobacteria bacterium]
MDRFDRIYALHKELRNARYPVPGQIFQQRLECSRATLNRIIEDMRNFIGAPIVYDRKANGYHYTQSGEHPYELPGLWFNASELYALLAVQQLLNQTQPGLLETHLSPLRKRIETILETEHLGSGELPSRVRILYSTARRITGESFQTVAGALMQRKRLHLCYLGREKNQLTEREISPQRLVHYRDNWYVDGWCHQRQALRSFSIDRIQNARTLNNPAEDINDTQLDLHFTSAYGIFAGQATHTAILRFTPERARWVADEQWHPAQQGSWLKDGSYELRIPYGDSRELIMDILKYGPDVEVVGPEGLRKEVVERLWEALKGYGRDV